MILGERAKVARDLMVYFPFLNEERFRTPESSKSPGSCFEAKNWNEASKHDEIYEKYHLEVQIHGGFGGR